MNDTDVEKTTSVSGDTDVEKTSVSGFKFTKCFDL
jgi:hypothetical protein